MDEINSGSLPQLQSQFNSGNPSQETQARNRASSPRKNRALLVIVVLVFLLAGAIRAFYLNMPGVAIDREYRSALIARAYYLQMTDSVSEWRRDVALAGIQRVGVLEPPITELLAALIYRAVNREHLWLARLLMSLFWLIGGIFLFKVAERIVSFEAAIFSTAYYLFVPLGVVAGRSFYPEPLMIMMFSLSLYAMVRHYDQPSMSRLIIAASVSGFAILIKPLVLFSLLGAFVSMAISKRATTPPSWSDGNMNENVATRDTPQAARLNGIFISAGRLKGLIDGQFLIFTVVSLLPTVFYYGYGILANDSLRRQAQGSFLPQLLFSTGYWKQWLLTAAGAVGYTALIAALLGLPMLRKGMPRALLIGLWAGYAGFCLLFTYHIRFAGYYHLQLVIIVALSFAPIIALVANHLRQLSNPWYWWLPVIGAVLLITIFNVRDIRRSQGVRRQLESKLIAQEIGQIVDHSSRVVYVAPYYGTPLEYYAELSGAYWPRGASDTDRALGVARERTIEERLGALDFAPEYFVITDLEEFNRHHTDLKEFLADNYPLLAESDNYLIYGVRTH